jgi:hypothetical protein
MVQRTGARPKIVVSGDGRGVVSHAGARLLADAAAVTGLTAACSDALAGVRQRRGGHDPGRVAVRQRRGGHDPGRVAVDLAVMLAVMLADMLADDGEAIADLAVLRDQAQLFGPVASDPTAWRLLSMMDGCPILSPRSTGCDAPTAGTAGPRRSTPPRRLTDARCSSPRSTRRSASLPPSSLPLTRSPESTTTLAARGAGRGGPAPAGAAWANADPGTGPGLVGTPARERRRGTAPTSSRTRRGARTAGAPAGWPSPAPDSAGTNSTGQAPPPRLPRHLRWRRSWWCRRRQRTRYGPPGVPRDVSVDTVGRLADGSPFYGGSRISVPTGSCTDAFSWNITAAGTVYLPGETVYRGDMALAQITSGKCSSARIYRGAYNSTSSNSVRSMWSRRAQSGDQYRTGGSYSGEICGWTVTPRASIGTSATSGSGTSW